MIAISPERKELVAEMHLRPSPVLDAPCRMVQLLVLLEDGDDDALIRFLAEYGLVDPTGPDRRDATAERDGVTYMWERHSEAFTLAAILPERLSEAARAEAIALVETVPGRVLRAIQVHIESDSSRAAEMIHKLSMKPQATVGGEVGKVRFWSDFRLREENGYGRLVVYSDDADPLFLGRIVRNLQELGNYRNLALLGLPLVRRRSAELARLEDEAQEAFGNLTGSMDDQKLLDKLIDLSAHLSYLRAETAYRLSATDAYGRIVIDRLKAIDPAPIGEFQTLSEFNNRRFLPALRTCDNFTMRVEKLAARIEQATNLLRARVDVAINEQNNAVLRSLDATARRQLQLQHLVEGLSIFAIAYYALGLLAYLLEAVPETLISDRHVVLGLLVAPVVVALYLMLYWQSRSRK